MFFFCYGRDLRKKGVPLPYHRSRRFAQLPVPHEKGVFYERKIPVFQEIVSLQQYPVVFLQRVKVILRHLRKRNIHEPAPVFWTVLNEFQFRGIEKHAVYVAHKFAYSRRFAAVYIHLFAVVFIKDYLHRNAAVRRLGDAFYLRRFAAVSYYQFVLSRPRRITRAQKEYGFRRVGLALRVGAGKNRQFFPETKGFFRIIAEIF